ncbi:MAG: DUF1003 domain-containing protein [Patescibacteria group bacterium]
MPRYVKKEFKRKSSWQDLMADKITGFVGSMGFVYFHVAWFLIWLIYNAIKGLNPWDPYPYNFLTMIVSLEAIFLSTFVLISQNREAERTDLRDQLDFEIDTKAQKQIESILRKLRDIEAELKKKR